MKVVRFNHATFTIDSRLTVLTEVTEKGYGAVVSLNSLTANERKQIFAQIL
jgi:hypothetical protein